MHPRPPASRARLLLTLGLAVTFSTLLPARAQEDSTTRGFLARLLQPGGDNGAPRRSGQPAAAPTTAAVPPSAGALSAPIRPDPKLTPGDTLEVTLDDIRTPGYSAKVRNVPVAVKRQVYAAYGITRWNKGEYEIDHLISLSLEGSNSTKNLWPQSYLSSPWNAHVKDALEYRLLTLARAGKVDLKTAQADMARDWIAAYKKYVGPEPGGSARRGGAGNPGAATVPGINLPPSPDRQPDVAAARAPARRARADAPAPVASPAAPTVPEAGQPAAQV